MIGLHLQCYVAMCFITSIQVTVVGNGRARAQEVIVAGDKLTNYDTLVTIGEELSLPLPIKQTRKELSNRIFR